MEIPKNVLPQLSLQREGLKVERLTMLPMKEQYSERIRSRLSSARIGKLCLLHTEIED